MIIIIIIILTIYYYNFCYCYWEILLNFEIEPSNGKLEMGSGVAGSCHWIATGSWNER